jgi:tetratricopeptide (TPR) repeat protein
MRTPGAKRALRATCAYVVAMSFVRLASAQGPELESSQLAVIHDQYLQAMEGGLYDEAADATKRYIGSLLRDDDVDEVAWGEALARLGDAQYLAGDLDEAIGNYVLAIEVLEENTNRLDESLVGPLIGLGRAHEEAGNYPDALAAYERGIHVRRVNMGLFALEQAETLDTMSRIYFRMGEHDAANGMQQAYAGIYAQNFPNDYLKQVPAQLSRAEMLVNTNKLIDAKLAYRRMINNIEQADSRRSLALLPVIYSFADLLQTRRIADGVNGDELAHRFLRRAVLIAKKNENATPIDLADAYIALADYYVTSKRDHEKASRFYIRAWEALSGDEQYFAARAERFEKPTLLNPAPGGMPPAMRRVLMLSMRDEEEKDARLVTRFDLDEFGRPHNINVAESDPAGYYDPILVRYVEMLPFRPGFADGRPARFDDQAYVIGYPSAELTVDLGQNSEQAAID